VLVGTVEEAVLVGSPALGRVGAFA